MNDELSRRAKVALETLPNFHAVGSNDRFDEIIT